MVPAQLLARAVTVLANTPPESFDFGDEFLTGHEFEISVQVASDSTAEYPTPRFNYSAFRRPFMSAYAVSISLTRAGASTARSGLYTRSRMAIMQ